MTKLAVVGCGMMGRGIVEVAAVAGMTVKAIKATPGDLAGPRAKLEQSLKRRVDKGKMSQDEAAAVMARVEFTSDLGAVRDADIVIESAVEDLETKIKLLKDVEQHMTNKEAILGTNTSSLRLEALAEGLGHPTRFVGIHFFSPVPAMALVEIGAPAKTAEFAVKRTEEFCTAIGKTPVRIQSAPGYVVNRLLVPYLLHGIETLESGIADAEGIDTAMKLGCGHPMGPLALSDLIGLDVVYAMAETLERELGDKARYRMPETLKKLHAAGQLGRKSKLGIFDYSVDPPRLNPAIQITK